MALLDRCIETLALLAHRSETVLSIEYFISLFDRLGINLCSFSFQFHSF